MYKLNYFSVLVILLTIFLNVSGENKYSREANVKKKSDIDFRTLDKPFRMAKINILWTKAQQVCSFICIMYRYM